MPIPAVAAHSLRERTLERLHHRMQDGATGVFSRSVRRRTERTPTAREAEHMDAPTGPTRLAEAAGAD